MSNSYLIQWFDKLLFGTSSPLPPTPPELNDLLLRIEAENIPWFHMIHHGGLTSFAYEVHGDLSYLIDYLERQWLEESPHYEPQPLKTRAVTKFWSELKCLLAKRDEIKIPTLPEPSENDDEILRHILENHPGVPSSYESAAFWGEVARRFILLRRPETVPALPDVSDDQLKRVMQLYTISSVARGQFVDPLCMRLVHDSEYVNPVHWQTLHNLKMFMVDRPTHALTQSIQMLLQQTVEDLLHGQKPSALFNTCPRLDALLHNVRVIHESVDQVPHTNTPPRLIDILQRLLALCYKDGLWEREIPPLEPRHPLIGASILYLTEQLRIAEREKLILMKHVMEDETESIPERPEHICSTGPYARHKKRSWHAQLERLGSPR